MKATNIKWDIDYDDDNDDLPKEIEIPSEILKNHDEDDYDEVISDYISDVTGYCHCGFELEGE